MLILMHLNPNQLTKPLLLITNGLVIIMVQKSGRYPKAMIHFWIGILQRLDVMKSNSLLLIVITLMVVIQNTFM